MKNRWLFFILVVINASSFFYPQKNITPIGVDQLLIKEDYKSAAAVLDSMIKTDSLNPALFYKLGVSYQKEYAWYKAINAFSHCISLDSSNVQAGISLGECYSELGEDNKAFTLYSDILHRNPLNYKIGILKAGASLKLRKYQDAFDTYKTLATADSLNSYLFRQMGYCAQMMDTSLLAAEYYNHALKLNNDDITALQHLITVYLLLKREDTAIYILKKRIEKEGDNLFYNKLLGEAYFSNKNYDTAIIYYEKANNLGDTTAYLYQKMGVAQYFYADHIDTSKSSERNLNFLISRDFLEKSFLQDPNAVTTYFLALANQKMDQYEAAVYYFDMAKKIIVPGFLPELFIHSAEAYKSLSNYPYAIEEYKKAFSINKDKSLLLIIAEIYENDFGDKEFAAHYYQEYINSTPENPEMTPKLKKKIAALKKGN